MSTWLWGLAARSRDYVWSTARRAAVSTGLVARAPTLADCPGYRVENVVEKAGGLTAELVLAGPACDVYGKDIGRLRLVVEYQTASRLHVKIEDAAGTAYQVPKSVFSGPEKSNSIASEASELMLTWEKDPFSFKVSRKSKDEVLFDSAAAPLVFSDQYIRLRTSLPKDPNLYGLGEHSDRLRLKTTNYTRTLWSRDAYSIPSGTNLYGNHPVYYDHRGTNGTHGVFLLSSSGMDVKIDCTEKDGQFLEYNVLGGVVDLYFMAGPTPIEVSQQYSEIVGKPTLMPYWSFGLHQCRYGYRDYLAIAEVVYKYAKASIPLETMWIDIDYMYNRFIMTTDPDRFPVERLREIIQYLHEHDQQFIVMVDPAVAHQTQRDNGLEYTTFTRARDEGLFLTRNGSIFMGVVWPGVTAYPDWFHTDAKKYWIEEFAKFFSPKDGVDIDGLWIDMNEAANFNFFGADAEQGAVDRGFPPARAALRSTPEPLPGFPATFQPDPKSPHPPDAQNYSPPWLAGDAAPNTAKPVSAWTKWISSLFEARSHALSQSGSDKSVSASGAPIIGYPNRNLISPPYRINNVNTMTTYGGLSNFTLGTDIIHHDGHVELDVHNLYGSMMSTISRTAMEARRPDRRPFIVTRSTFAGDGKYVAKWLGDNLSTWKLYRQSIQGMLDFAALYQMPMVGSDVCGFGGDATEKLSARWATLGAFYPFMRNHNSDTSLPQEFYLSPLAAAAAKRALDIRYRLLDYLYTAFYRQNQNGSPVLSPLFYKYPTDNRTFGIDLQFFYGDCLLVSPVTEEDATSVEIYMPKDLFYDFDTYLPVRGAGASVIIEDVAFDRIPVHIKAGSVIPMRSNGAMTTKALRREPFHLLVAPDEQGEARGDLYLDDGDSIVQKATSVVEFEWHGGILDVSGSFEYAPVAEGESIAVEKVTVLGVKSGDVAEKVLLEKGGEEVEIGAEHLVYSSESQSLEIRFPRAIELDGPFTLAVKPGVTFYPAVKL